MSEHSFIESKYFCILPWIHLHVSQNGRVSPCCNNNRYLGNVREQSIDEIWKGKSFEELRKQFEMGIPDKRCSHCYNIEASGKQSMRQISNEKYVVELDRVATHNPQPIYLDIRFSNVCNFKCKTCWHGNSSAWFEDGSKRNASEERLIKAFTTDFDALLPYLNEVQEIYFAGGEPLIMEEHYRLLEELEKRQLFDVELRYNTNFSTLYFKKKDILDSWKKFKKVHVSASIDAAFELGEEIREGFNWEEFVSNRKHMMKKASEIYFEITPTVSALNIHEIPSLHRIMVEQELIELDHIYLNFLERPSEWSVKNMMDEQKLHGTVVLKNHLDWLKNKGAGITIVKQFEDLLNYMGKS